MASSLILRKSLLIICIFISFSYSLHAQTTRRGPDLKKLSGEITLGKETDEKKVRAIYEWITSNIEYMVRPQWILPGGSRLEDLNDTGGLKSLDERVAEAVVETGMGVCDGYSRLFKVLCYYAGIESELVQGYARGWRAIFASNHTWNAVRIGEEWKLLDVTWASGYLSFHGRNFVRELDDSWYLVSPVQFILDHFPDEPRWSLLDEIPVLSEFRHSPFRQKAFIKYRIKSFFPKEGVITADLHETVDLKLNISDFKRDQQIGPDPFLDTMNYKQGDCIILRPAMLSNDAIVYQFKITDPAIRWVYLMYNDDIVLRYYRRPRN